MTTTFGSRSPRRVAATLCFGTPEDKVETTKRDQDHYHTDPE